MNYSYNPKNRVPGTKREGALYSIIATDKRFKEILVCHIKASTILLRMPTK